MLIPFWQIPWPQSGFGVRTQENPASMLKSIAAAVHSVDPTVALAQPKTMDEVIDESMANQRFTLVLFTTFAVVALFLAALGIYGVMSFSVAQRSHEIALRMALGASRDKVVGLIIRDGVLLAAIGLGLGMFGAYFVGRGMQSMLFGVQALDVCRIHRCGVSSISGRNPCLLPACKASRLRRTHACLTDGIARVSALGWQRRRESILL